MPLELSSVRSRYFAYVCRRVPFRRCPALVLHHAACISRRANTILIAQGAELLGGNDSDARTKPRHVLTTERIAHDTVTNETAAVRDFDPAYDRSGSDSAVPRRP
jgi:hypothetical protein